jgi:antitoxin component of RelBE/YafQ-DinJ toxin-antitoxin module
MDLDLTPWQIAAIQSEITRLRDSEEFEILGRRVARQSGIPLEVIASTAVNLLTMRAVLTAEGAMAIVSEELAAW